MSRTALIPVSLAALLVTSTSALCAPSLADAKAVLDAMQEFRSTELLLASRTAAQRRDAMGKATTVAKRAEAVFGPDVLGPWGSCSQAGMLFLDYAQGASDLARVINGEARPEGSLLGGHRTAADFGDAYRRCKALVEQLK